jgi:energy-converting hydrogenase Eha subunit C
MQNIPESFHELRWAVFAFVGGGIGYLLRSKKIQRRDLIIESLGAGFVGAIVSMAAKYYALGVEATGVLVGVSALIGARATLRFFKEQILRRFGATTDEGSAK